MTDKQKEEHNRMRNAHKQISKQFESLSELKKRADEKHGLSYVEALETQVNSMKKVAAEAVKGIRVAK